MTSKEATEDANDEYWDAFSDGDVSKVKKVLDARILDSYFVDSTLGDVMEGGRLEMMRCLLESGMTVEMLELFAEFGVDFKNPRYNVLPSVVDNREALDWLLDRGVDPNCSSPWVIGVTPDERDDTCQVLNEAAARGDIETFEYLVQRGADPSRSIALHTAIRCKDPIKTVEMLSHLVQKYKFDVNVEDDLCGGLRFFLKYFWAQGSPMCWALAKDNLAAVKFLLRQGVDPTDTFHLHIAVERGSLASVQLLIEAGADPSRAYESAVRLEKPDVVELCLAKGAKPPPAPADT